MTAPPSGTDAVKAGVTSDAPDSTTLDGTSLDSEAGAEGLAAGDAAASEADSPDRGGRRWSRALTHPIGLPVVAIGLTILPLVLTIIKLLTSIGNHRYAIFGDQAYFELHVRDIGHHPVQVGPFSRYGWSHPGPAMYYLLAPMYYLLGDASQSFAITTLTVNAGCVVAIALLVRRRVGTPSMLWTLAVLAVYLRVAGPLFVRDSWNPNLPVLPLALLVFLAWSACYGARWGVPFGAAIASFCVQSHIGFLIAVLGVAAVPVVLLAWRLLRRQTRIGGVLSRWWLPLLLGLVVTVVMWLPPVSQQLTGIPATCRSCGTTSAPRSPPAPGPTGSGG